MNFNPTENEINFINKALTKFNDEKVGPDNHELLNIVEYNDIPIGNKKYHLIKELNIF